MLDGGLGLHSDRALIKPDSLRGIGDFLFEIRVFVMTCLRMILCRAVMPAAVSLFAAEAAAPPAEWLLKPSDFKASIAQDSTKRDLILTNGLVRRTLRLAPNAATVDYCNLVTGEQLLRATGPEARVTLNGREFAIGGLSGQPVGNYLKTAWIDALKADPAAYRLADWKEGPLEARFAWKKRPEWLAKDLPWPASGRQVTLRFVPPAVSGVSIGKVLFNEDFLGGMDPAWKTHASDKHPRTSFSNEGKHGEIMALPDTSVYAERPWPANAASVEAQVDAGDDTSSNAWGPGLALVTAKGNVSFVIRPNQQCYDLNGEPQAVKFDRSKPCRLRVSLDGLDAICEATQNGEIYDTVAKIRLPSSPTALRVGKVGQAARGDDYPGTNGNGVIRCHVSRVVLREAAPVSASPATAIPDLPEIDVHYAVYDGIPLIEKWLTVRNTSTKPCRVDATVVETLKVQEGESSVEPNVSWEQPNLYVETDYAYMAMTGKAATSRSVKWLPDKSYKTQVNYNLETPCLLEVAPEFGPGVEVPPGGSLVSLRAFELFHDATDRELRGLAQRRMYRVIAPWTQENPVMMHLISNDPAAIRKTIDQAAEVGVEMIILSFGSGINMESRDAAYQAKYREVADYARSKGIVIGAYSLLASRGAATAADNCHGPGSRVLFGVMPCLGSKWGKGYLAQLKSFMSTTGFGILEHDGSYPGDTCAAINHPGHRGLADSQWTQFAEIRDLYQWCRGNGVYLNIPDWYYLNGGNKSGMGYRETNWSLPRAEQEIIERQNIYDGTWEKTPSMGWMFVPLTQYHGGGAAATIEPLAEHLDHYETRLANLFGAGVQACYRGPRIYDTDETRAVVRKWISFYKQHREVLDGDILHLRRPDGRDWDGFVHVNPLGAEKALAFFYNPLESPVTRTIRIPLHQAGLERHARMTMEGAAECEVPLDPGGTATVDITIPARGRIWMVFR